MRPQLKPALRRVWRDATTLQLGLDPDRAVVIGGLDAGAVRLVDSLDGSRDLPGVLATAADLGVEAWRAGELIDLLARAGVLDDAAADRRPLGALDRQERERLGPDLAAASALRRGSDGGVAVLARRRAGVVEVHGAGRVGASVVTLLAAAGVGAVAADDPAPTLLTDAAPAGLAPGDVGARRQDAAAAAARRAAPAVRSRLPRSRPPDVAVVAPVGPLDPALPDRLLRAGVPHLFATVREGTGVVGPLVLPGRSSCHRCHDLHRADRDPAWPSIRAQLAGPAPRVATPCDVVLATAVAAHTALQVLALLDWRAGPDGDGPDTTEAPPTVDGTLEIGQADGRVRRRSWSMHPLCGCGWERG